MRRTLLIDAAIVAAITVFIALVSQRWTGFNSPDSEFYASLAIFGSDVTDRALEAAYTWTRLGYVAPVHALTSLFGIWAGKVTLLPGVDYTKPAFDMDDAA